MRYGIYVMHRCRDRDESSFILKKKKLLLHINIISLTPSPFFRKHGNIDPLLIIHAFDHACE